MAEQEPKQRTSSTRKSVKLESTRVWKHWTTAAPENIYIWVTDGKEVWMTFSDGQPFHQGVRPKYWMEVSERPAPPQVKEEKAAPVDLFQTGDYTLSSGIDSWFKIDCDALSDGSIETLARMVCRLVGPFSSVEGVPTGGLRLARTLQQYACESGPHLIVDDVFTTGGSMERAYRAWRERKEAAGGVGFPLGCVGAVIFARGKCPFWVAAVCPLPQCFWPEQPENQK